MSYFDLFCTCIIGATGITIGVLTSAIVVLKILDWYFTWRE